MSREAMKLALDALEGFIPYLPIDDKQQCNRYDKAITALRAALDAPEPEPVAWELRKGKTDRVLLEITNNAKRAHDWKCSLEEIVPLYTRPQPAAPREWVGLTEEEKSDIWCAVTGREWVTEDTHVYADAIEAKLKEKNGVA